METGDIVTCVMLFLLAAVLAYGLVSMKNTSNVDVDFCKNGVKEVHITVDGRSIDVICKEK